MFASPFFGFQFNLKLPAAVEEYYEVKAKAEEAGWEPGQVSRVISSETGCVLTVEVFGQMVLLIPPLILSLSVCLLLVK